MRKRERESRSWSSSWREWNEEQARKPDWMEQHRIHTHGKAGISCFLKAVDQVIWRWGLHQGHNSLCRVLVHVGSLMLKGRGLILRCHGGFVWGVPGEKLGKFFVAEVESGTVSPLHDLPILLSLEYLSIHTFNAKVLGRLRMAFIHVRWTFECSMSWNNGPFEAREGN